MYLHAEILHSLVPRGAFFPPFASTWFAMNENQHPRGRNHPVLGKYEIIQITHLMQIMHKMFKIQITHIKHKIVQFKVSLTLANAERSMAVSSMDVVLEVQ